MDFLRQTINIVADVLVMLIFMRVILSWFVRRETGLTRFLKDATDPIIKPIRRALPSFGMLDLSPIVAFFLIEVLREILNAFI
jgi:YggT family protein